LRAASDELNALPCKRCAADVAGAGALDTIDDCGCTRLAWAILDVAVARRTAFMSLTQ